MVQLHVGVLGATSIVGKSLLAQFQHENWKITAFSRKEHEPGDGSVKWRKLPPSFQASNNPDKPQGIIPYWICAAPIWVLPEYFTLLELCGVRKIVAVSSTSRFTKNESSDPEEQNIARQLADAEAHLENWATKVGVEWVILRPTLIYGYGQDKNISEIARFIRRFGFFPLFGKANGLRQPIHCEDVAKACMTALNSPQVRNHSYNISGGETLTYREMVTRVFIALGQRPLFLIVPLWVFHFSVIIIRHLPRYKNWTTTMAERMNRDLVFDHIDATYDLEFNPRKFKLPKNCS